MTSLTYEMSDTRARQLVGRLKAAGYNAGLPPKRLASTSQHVVIRDLTAEQTGEVHALVKGLEPMANPVLS